MKQEKRETWQSRKSDTTRIAVLEAATQCYIKIGYANTTVTKIAEEAQLSRGAMMYHFDDVQAIIVASVGYLTEKRLQEYGTLLVKAEREAGGRVTEESLEMTINALWKFFHSRYHIAYQELIVAARTDESIAKVMHPAQQEFDKRIAEHIRSHFPAWQGVEEVRETITELYFYALQGVSFFSLSTNKQPKIKRLFSLLVKTALNEYADATADIKEAN
ncbi:MAG: TetR/AcrR family transcriptional regulator [Pseudomonadota bacterium]